MALCGCQLVQFKMLMVIICIEIFLEADKFGTLFEFEAVGYLLICFLVEWY